MTKPLEGPVPAAPGEVSRRSPDEVPPWTGVAGNEGATYGRQSAVLICHAKFDATIGVGVRIG
jgi:hypothetical protein